MVEGELTVSMQLTASRRIGAGAPLPALAPATRSRRLHEMEVLSRPALALAQGVFLEVMLALAWIGAGRRE